MSGATGIRAIAYALPAATRTGRELAASGALESEAAVLERFGVLRVHVAVEESPYELASVAAARLLTAERIDPASIGLLVYGGPPSAARLRYELGLDGASVVAVDQLACTTLFGAVRVARALCTAEGIDRALCVSGECYPALAGREASLDCTSDAACAILLEREAAHQRICGAATITRGHHWDPTAHREETVASYFPTAVRAINSTLVDAGWERDDVDWVIPHTASVASWEMLIRLAGLTRARLWTDDVAVHGHTLAGDRALLFSYGYGYGSGAHWTGLAVEI